MPLNAHGQQGSWFARYKGARYPCVHDRYMNWVSRTYSDPDPDHRISAEYVAEITALRRVLVTESNADGSRHHYKAFVEVSKVQWHEGTLTFVAVRRLE